MHAGVSQNVTFLRYGSILTLGDSPCTLLVSLWLGEVVGASLAMGHALVQSLLELLEPSYQSFGAPSVLRRSAESVVRR